MMNERPNWFNAEPTEGILRKPKPVQHTADNLDDLLIFGYACKIFRDNERAKLIDHGKHLIPWMGDNSLKIDRYDVRATLSDIAPYEAPPGGYIDRLGYLSVAEQRAEQLCEEERYFSLYNNEMDEDMYKEEESKREYGQQVEFNYDKVDNADPSASTTVGAAATIADKDDETDEPFVPHPNFIIPDDIELPESKKLNVIIEKTAQFISLQGPQMEILIKAKQSNNPNFKFLNQNDCYNAYYKHMLAAIKSGEYPMADELTSSDGTNKDNKNDELNGNDLTDTDEFSYLNQIYTTTVSVPTLKYKPSADCSYTQLISKIKGVPLPVNDFVQSALSSETMSTTNSGHHQNNFGSVEYGEEKLITSLPVLPSSFLHPTLPPPPASSSLSLSSASSTQPTEPTTSENTSSTSTNNNKTNDSVEIKKISTGLMLAQSYGTDSEDEDDDEDDGAGGGNDNKDDNITKDKNDQVDKKNCIDDVTSQLIQAAIPKPPPIELQNIIDKTAAYVLKNGKEFEKILLTKNDPRFSFLLRNDPFNRYYVYKVTGAIPADVVLKSTGTISSNSSSSITKSTIESNKKLNTQSENSSTVQKSAKVITSVSFSIKPKDEQTSLKTTLLNDPSSSDEDNNHHQEEILTDKQHNSKTVDIINKTSNNLIENLPSTEQTISTKSINSFESIDTCDSSMRDAILESHSIDVEDNTTNRNSDRTKNSNPNVNNIINNNNNNNHHINKLNDRRNKVTGGSTTTTEGIEGTKEKQLQLERKKRALAFLNSMKTSNMKKSTTNTNEQNSKQENVDQIGIEIIENVESVASSSSSSLSTATTSLPATINTNNSSSSNASTSHNHLKRDISQHRHHNNHHHQHHHQQQQQRHQRLGYNEKESMSEKLRDYNSRSRSRSTSKSHRHHSKYEKSEKLMVKKNHHQSRRSNSSCRSNSINRSSCSDGNDDHDNDDNDDGGDGGNKSSSSDSSRNKQNKLKRKSSRSRSRSKSRSKSKRSHHSRNKSSKKSKIRKKSKD